MGWLTDALAVVAPRYATKRALQLRAYEAATKGRRGKHWNASNTSATAENQAAATVLRNRARDALRNDPYAGQAVDIWTESAEGIRPTPETGSDRLDRQIEEAFGAFSETCDPEGVGDWHEQQALGIRTILESGDVLVRRRMRRAEDGLTIPLQLQLLEPDHLDGSRIANGLNDIVAGIEIDRLNRRQAYWLYPEHPGENRLGRGISLTASRVPADQIAHAFRRTRAGQMIGVPFLHRVLLDLRDLDDLEQASLMQQKIASCFGAFVRRSDAGARQGLLGEEDEDDDQLERLEPGMVEYLEPGEDVSFATPPSTAGHSDYIRSRLHRIAAGARMPYILLTGDVSQANWASYKAGIVPFKSAVRHFQKRTVLPNLLRPQWRWFIDSAYLAGRIDERNYGVNWTLPGFEPIDRYKEAIADQIEARIGTRSIREAIRASGRDPAAVLAEIKQWSQEVDKAELVFDSDPRKVSNAGLTQARPQGTVLPPTGAPADTPETDTDEEADDA